MPKREDHLLVADIVDCMEAVFSYTKDISYEDFCADRKTYEATFRNIEVIGEAVSLTSENLRTKYPLVEWREMKSFRNKLIHDYFGIDLETVWSVIYTDLPHNYELLKRIQF